MKINSILIKIAMIHVLAIMLVFYYGFGSGYPFIQDIGKILLSFLLPLGAYSYILFRSEAINKKTEKLKNEGIFLLSLVVWLLALWVLLNFLWNTKNPLSLEDFNYCMDLLNSVKLFFFALYIPALFPEPKEEQ